MPSDIIIVKTGQSPIATSSRYAVFAEWCHEHQIRLLLVQAPVTNGYYKRIDKRQRHFIKSLSLIPYVQILDYSDDKRFNDHDFFDADHLTDEGARKWSEMINNTIL